MACSSEVQAPRSTMRQRSEQKGRWGDCSDHSTNFLQLGQGSLTGFWRRFARLQHFFVTSAFTGFDFGCHDFSSVFRLLLWFFLGGCGQKSSSGINRCITLPLLSICHCLSI